MRVLHVCPTYFGADSIIAGGERYSYGLAMAMARITPTTLVTFGDSSFVRRDGELTIRCYRRWAYVKGRRHNPLSMTFLRDVVGADVVHCHQYQTVATDIALIGGTLTRKRLFITDLGGGADFSLCGRFPLWRAARGFMLISDYNRSLFDRIGAKKTVIYGGVDVEYFAPQGGERSGRILFVGRMMRHKGVHLLIDALGPDMHLDVVGQVSDPGYAAEVKSQARGKKVVFHDDLPEDRLLELYRAASLVAIPSLVDGGYTTALEAMSCATPVVATAVGSMPELVADGETGLLVSLDDGPGLRSSLRRLLEAPSLALAMGQAGRRRVETLFTWKRVAERCMQEYAA
jgi:glycosyltransferase involved in cell wall biosynthesis